MIFFLGSYLLSRVHLSVGTSAPQAAWQKKTSMDKYRKFFKHDTKVQKVDSKICFHKSTSTRQIAAFQLFGLLGLCGVFV